MSRVNGTRIAAASTSQDRPTTLPSETTKVPKEEDEIKEEEVDASAVLSAGPSQPPRRKAKEVVEIKDEVDDDPDIKVEVKVKAGSELPDGRDLGRIVAVDWALSKSDWEKSRRVEDGDGDGDVDMKDEDEDEVPSAADDEDGDEDGSGESDDDDDQGTDDSDEDTQSENDSSASEPNEEAEPSTPEEPQGTTLFIRNLPFEATDDDLRNLYVPCALPTSDSLFFFWG